MRKWKHTMQRNWKRNPTKSIKKKVQSLDAGEIA